jgi:hypothetical protein
MNKLTELMGEDRRLLLLRLLAESNGFVASADLLHTVLGSMGHGVSRARLEADLALLEELALVQQEQVGLCLVRITARGVDVASGMASAPGIARPRPGP